MPLIRLFLLITLLFVARNGWGQTPPPRTPVLMPASGEGHAAIEQFKFPKNLKCELFAAEPDVANIVAFHRDYSGRFFVCETFRQNTDTGVEDNRKHAHWMDEELAAQTVQDRIDYIRKYIPNADEAYTENDDRIRMLVDTDHDGKSDRSTVFADHFNRLEMGTGAGVLSYREMVYYTCIPELFLLKDTNKDGVADERKSLHQGFGVRFAFRGHDMHGLIVGPDGRLYFSIGDRGYNVAPELHDATSGAVFRCELDGSGLEVFCTGLRNPQELAFDDLGNLFTGDNNSDGGDKARWVYLVPGGDSGWRMYYQYLPDRGPFNREKIWYPFNQAETPAYIVPPVDNLGDGPSGLEYYPGTGFGDEFAGRFFLCDFRGGPANSGIRAVRCEQVGAFWKIAESEQPFWGVLPTDIDFGSDGKLYLADWVNGWVGENKGRIYAFFDPTKVDSPLVKEVQTLLRDGLSDKSAVELKTLLSHADQRVRQEAQFELVARNGLATLKSSTAAGELRIARVHAIWGIGQLIRSSARSSKVGSSNETISSIAIENLVSNSRRQPDLASELEPWVASLLTDEDFEIRAQAAQLAGDAKMSVEDSLIDLLKDENLRVRYFAAIALSKIGDQKSVQPIAVLLAENKDFDPIVRHGGIVALKHLLHDIGESSDRITATLALSHHESASVRLALCVAVRKCFADPNREEYGLGRLRDVYKTLLADSDRAVYLETVRAIHDLPIPELLPTVADQIAAVRKRLDQSIHDDALLRRLINANFRVGQLSNAVALAEFAADSAFPAERRAEALSALTQWITPSSNDAVLHDWRPIDTSQRKLADAQIAMLSHYPEYIAEPVPVSTVAIEAAGKLKLSGIDSMLTDAATSNTTESENRVAALDGLAELESLELPKTLARLEKEFDTLPTEISSTVARLISKSDSKRGFDLNQRLLNASATPFATKQSIIATFGSFTDQDSATWLAKALQQSQNQTLAPELRLDVAVAAQSRPEPALSTSLKYYRQSLGDPDNPSAVYRDSLVGGNLDRGQKIFFEKSEVSCMRCHRADGSGGAVGPDLSSVGIKNDRQYLLDSIVQPNKKIADGYAQVKIQTIDGEIFTGLKVGESETEIQLMDPDGKKISILQDDIDGIKPGLSSMPDDLIKQLSPNELRDLVEYLATRVTPPEPVSGEGEGHEAP